MNGKGGTASRDLPLNFLMSFESHIITQVSRFRMVTDVLLLKQDYLLIGKLNEYKFIIRKNGNVTVLYIEKHVIIKFTSLYLINTKVICY